jgi:hypothetical protein
MKRAIKEFIWLSGTLIPAYLVCGLILGNSAMDINLHDTYFTNGGVIGLSTSMLFVFTWFIISGLGIYLTRVLLAQFKVIAIDAILIIFVSLSLYFISDVLFVFHSNWPSGLIKIFLMTIMIFTSFMTGYRWFAKS